MVGVSMGSVYGGGGSVSVIVREGVNLLGGKLLWEWQLVVYFCSSQLGLI